MALFNRLLDRFEDAMGSQKPGNQFAEFVSQRFDSLAEEQSFKISVEHAEQTGAVSLEMDKGDNDHLMKRVTLVDAQRLYEFLGRTPKSDKLAEAKKVIDAFVLTLSSEHRPHASEAAEKLLKQWKSNKRPHRLSETDIDAVSDFLRAYGAALAKEDSDGRDLRTYSRVSCGDSKLIESQLPKIISELREQQKFGPDLSDDAIVSELGLDKFPHLVQFAADIPFSKAHFQNKVHIGIHPRMIEKLEVPPLHTLITVENYASFNRFVSEAMEPRMAVVYTGGWPGSGEKALIRKLSRHLSEGVFHWGDIDMAGAAIADAVWRIVECPFQLHMMSPDLARKFGTPSSFDKISVDPKSPSYELIHWLSGEDAHRLEQEELDPCPVPTNAKIKL